MTHQGFSSKYANNNLTTINAKNKIVSSSFIQGTGNTEFDSYLESHHDKYFYELLHRHEMAILGGTNITSALQDEHMFLDINV